MYCQSYYQQNIINWTEEDAFEHLVVNIGELDSNILLSLHEHCIFSVMSFISFDNNLSCSLKVKAIDNQERDLSIIEFAKLKWLVCYATDIIDDYGLDPNIWHEHHIQSSDLMMYISHIKRQPFLMQIKKSPNFQYVHPKFVPKSIVNKPTIPISVENAVSNTALPVSNHVNANEIIAKEVEDCISVRNDDCLIHHQV